MTRRRRRLLWLVVLLANAALVAPVGTVLVMASWVLLPGLNDTDGLDLLDGIGDVLEDPEYWAWALPVGAVITLTQVVFLVPVVRLRPPRGRRGRSLTASLVVAAAIAACVVTAMGLGLMELSGQVAAGNLWPPYDVDPWRGEELLGQPWAGAAAVLLLLGSWTGWSVLLIGFSWSRWDDTLLGRAAGAILGGTLAELLIVIPIDQMVRRRTDCYCATGTFFSLIGSAVALVWLTGPGIVFALTSKRRRLLRETHCARCGYAKGPLAPAAAGPAGPRTCPECGADWSPGR